MRRAFLFLSFVLSFLAPVATAQDKLTIATITRPPFSLENEGIDTGFSVDLWNALAEELDLEFEWRRVEVFGEMLELVRTGAVDGAIANISITAEREKVMDFTHPIFESGLQIMMRDTGANASILRVLLSRDLMLAIAAAFAVLFSAGMLMWVFERRKQPYFDVPFRFALFSSFWWALNLVVNGGFEERMPRSVLGRLFGTFLVIASLFVVSFFVAKITSVLTVDALQSSVSSVADLRGRRVGTTQGSTASIYLSRRDVDHREYPDLKQLLQSFEEERLDAVVFDAPILAYYLATKDSDGRLVGRVFKAENYGMALPQGSPAAEEINQALLSLRERGVYARLYRQWFGRDLDD